MKKFLVSLIFCVSALVANEDDVVKTSELELFLFKVGFESLLKDVDVTKDKSNLNSEEIVKINQKIELIMNELYKSNRVLLNDSKENRAIPSQELENLKSEIAFLKQEITELKNSKKEVIVVKKQEEPKKEKRVIQKQAKQEQKVEAAILINPSSLDSLNKKLMRVATKKLLILDAPHDKANEISSILRNNWIEVEKDKNGWYKLSNKEGYVRGHYLREK